MSEVANIRALIYGSNGWIGQQLIELLQAEGIKHTRGIARVNDIPHLTKEIEQTKPTHIVSFIGRTHGVIGDEVYPTIDYLEKEGKLAENVRDNLFCPLSLAVLCERRQIHLTYLGTGCIFKFDSDHPFGQEISGFSEESLPNFFESAYSTVKGFTDQLMHLFPDTVLNLRIRMPITGQKNSRNFITKITTYDKICSTPNSMTVLPEMLPLVVDMMKNNITGTINLTNPGLISHDQILAMYREIVDPAFTWKNFTVEQQDQILLAGRSNNYLDTSKLQELYPKVLPIEEAVRKCLLSYKTQVGMVEDEVAGNQPSRS